MPPSLRLSPLLLLLRCRRRDGSASPKPGRDLARTSRRVAANSCPLEQGSRCYWCEKICQPSLFRELAEGRIARLRESICGGENERSKSNTEAKVRLMCQALAEESADPPFYCLTRVPPKDQEITKDSQPYHPSTCKQQPSKTKHPRTISLVALHFIAELIN